MAWQIFSIGAHIALFRHTRRRKSGEVLETIMSALWSNKKTRRQALQCATREDFELIFTEQMASLHTLAFLLTADEAMAEMCFVAGLQDSVDGNMVFRQWAHAWARRAIIRNAVRLMPAIPKFASHDPVTCQSPKESRSEQQVLTDAVMQLPAFERFVFVISVLEGHSLSDTASLLSCTNTQLEQARSRAFEKIGCLLGAAGTHESLGASQPHWYPGLEIA